MTHTVRFQPGNKTIDVREKTSLAVAAAEAGFLLRSDCAGQGVCGKCMVFIDGEERLACRVTIDRDLEVTIPETSLQNDDRSVVVQAQSYLPSGDRESREVRFRRNHRFGAALDLGTTTLAAELFEFPSESPVRREEEAHLAEPRFCGVVSRANPQRNFGDDVVSRIQKVIEEPLFLDRFQEMIVGAVNEMLEELAEKRGVRAGEISLLSVAGNTVMEHLLLGIDPSPLGFAPFTPPVSVYPDRSGKSLGLHMAGDGTVETLPIFGGFVGGDIVAGVMATGLHEPPSKGPALLIDIGTNGELVLVDDGEIYTAATAAGPAFEGARIEFGSLAVPGAIDRVEIRDDGEVVVSTIGDRPAVGLCGSGLIDAASELLRHRLIKPTGQFHVKPDSPFLDRWKMFDGKPAFELVSENDSGRKESILLTQRDIRQLQLATGAIRAGIQLLLNRLGLRTDQIERFDIAGGFGSFIRPDSARRVGLLPHDVPPERVRFCGNTSLAGARLALLDPDRLQEAIELVRRAHHLDLASLPDFAAVFAESMMFHETD